MISHRLRLHLLQHVILVDLAECIFFSKAVDRARLCVQQAVAILVELGLEIMGKLVDAVDFALHVALKLCTLSACLDQAFINHALLRLGKLAQARDSFKL